MCSSDLGGESSVDYASAGVEAHFRLPARHLRIESGAAPIETDVAPVVASFETDELSTAMRIMLLEDQMLIAMDVETMFADRGYTNLTTCNTAEEALRQLAVAAPDVAVLDVNLGIGTSIGVAERLVAMGVPFVFASGYGDGGILPESLLHVPMLRKPYDIDGLLGVLGRALAAQQRQD